MRCIIGYAIIAALLILSSCVTAPIVEKPGGFAGLADGESGEYRAVSPEGMLYRVRTVENYPVQGLEFWASALENHLKQEGYVGLSEGVAFHTLDVPGMFFEWALPYGNESYIYLTAIAVFDNTIVIAEAAAEHSIYFQYRDALHESLTGISIP